MTNRFISQQCENMILTIGHFEMACEMAANKDDSYTSREEEKILRDIKTAGEKFKKELLKISK